MGVAADVAIGHLTLTLWLMRQSTLPRPVQALSSATIHRLVLRCFIDNGRKNMVRPNSVDFQIRSSQAFALKTQALE